MSLSALPPHIKSMHSTDAFEPASPNDRRATHVNGRRVAEILRDQTRLCVWFVEADAMGGLARVPYWGTAVAYDPARGLKVRFDSAEATVGDEEFIDEGDDWEWEPEPRDETADGCTTGGRRS